MGKNKKQQQRLLQISFGVCLIFFALLIERVAVHPSGIYSYSKKGYKEFKIGASKAMVLKKINKRKPIRAIRACGPDKLFELTSRKGFVLEEELAASDFWICRDRTGKSFMFVFRKERLDRVLVQRLRFGKKKQGSILFSQCNPDILKDIDTYLSTREVLTVYRE